MREKLIEMIRKADKEDHESLTQDVHYAFMADNLIANGVVPVVRCKDCKHYDKDALWCNINSPMFSEEHYNWYEDDFCSIGERRTDNDYI